MLLCAAAAAVRMQGSRCENQIDDLCVEIEKTINKSIQNTLSNLERDAQLITDEIDKKLLRDRYTWIFLIITKNYSLLLKLIVLYVLIIRHFNSFSLCS